MQKISLTPSADGILLLNNETLVEIEEHRERPERQEKKLEEAPNWKSSGFEGIIKR